MGVLGLGKQNLKSMPQPGTQVEEGEVNPYEGLETVGVSELENSLSWLVGKSVTIRVVTGNTFTGCVLKVDNEFIYLRNACVSNVIVIRRNAVVFINTNMWVRD